METWYGLLVYIGVFLAGLLGAKWAFSFAQSRQKGGEINISLLLGIVVLTALFVGVSFFLVDTAGDVAFFLYALMAMGLILSVLFDSKLPSVGYAVGSIILCFICTYFLPTQPANETIVGGIVTHLGLAIGWSLAIWVFLKMDRVPFFSMTFSITFALFYFLMANVSHRISDIFSILALLLLSIQVGINWYLKRHTLPVLGQSAGAFVGFIWGGLTTYVVAQGNLTQAVILYAYSMIEVFWSTIVCIAVYQRFEPAYPYMIEQALSKNIQPDKVLKNVTKWLAVMACLAYLSVVNTNLSMGVFYISAGILMLNACMRLTSWGQWGAKGPRLRDMFKDMKAGLKQAKEEWSKLPLKDVQEQLSALRHKKEVSADNVSEPIKEMSDNPDKPVLKSQTKNTKKSQKKSPKTKRGG